MASIKRRDTKPELLLRKELWRRGLRGYRLDVQLPGRPDIFFPKHKLCIFVDGCFWHGCPIHYKGVARNTEYWDAKIQRNIARDQAITKSLIAMGFAVMQGSIRSRRVIEVLAKLVSEHGAPRYLRSDNGPEFVSRAILRWLHGEGIETAFIEPGKPWQNGTAESLNGKFRDECLSMEWFRNRFEAKVLIETWRRHYNEDRPHSSLGYRTPKQFKAEQKQQDESSTTPAILN